MPPDARMRVEKYVLTVAENLKVQKFQSTIIADFELVQINAFKKVFPKLI